MQNTVFDLGVNNGDDTNYYLKLGMRVFGIEANPTLCQHCENRFGNEISTGQLTIINKAISHQSGLVEFFVNEDNHHWSSLDETWASRENSAVEKIEIETLDLASLIHEFGAPYFIKIDIEGADQTALEQLIEAKSQPNYLSIEDCHKGYSYLEILRLLGYTSFTLSDQSRVVDQDSGLVDYKFPTGASGAFGKYLRSEWLDYSQFLSKYEEEVRGSDLKRIAPLPTWWDIHCC